MGLSNKDDHPKTKAIQKIIQIHRWKEEEITMKRTFRNTILAAVLAIATVFGATAGTIAATATTAEATTYTETRYSCVQTGFLALRSAPCYDDSNIIYQIWRNGTELCMTGQRSGSYGYCYCPAAGCYGWVNTNYTTLGSTYCAPSTPAQAPAASAPATTGTVRYSCVQTGFLALRTAPCYDDSNIIYQIWCNGTKLCMTGQYSGDYGYCYCPAAGCYGWVNVKYTYA